MTKENTKKKTMQELPKEVRPYEKCEQYGVEKLSDIELMSVLLGSGTKGKSALELASEILYPDVSVNGTGTIYGWTIHNLVKIRGIGRVKAIQILCIAELAKRLSKASAKERLSFQDPKSIVEYYKEDLRHLQQEHMILILLNTKGNLISDSVISIGTVDSMVLSCRELFIEALQKGAVNIVLIHNHPSGDPTPSAEDKNTTKLVEGSGKLLGITLLDHIIIGNNCYYSFMEEKIRNT